MGLVTNNAINPLSTISTSPSGFNGPGGTNTFEFTIPPGTVATVNLPEFEAEALPAVLSVVFENITGSSVGGAATVYVYSNTATSISVTQTGNLVSSGTPTTSQLKIEKVSGTRILRFTTDTAGGGLTNGAKVRVTRLA